jgi:hypothetical protein
LINSDFRPDIFHFIGHGKSGQLALSRDPDEVQADRDTSPKGTKVREHTLYNATDVTQLFANHMPRLVFLHACETAVGGSVESFSNLARELVKSGVPSVIAMQYEIKNEDAALFANTFYKEIAKGSYLDEAVCRGRAQLSEPKDNKKPFGDRRFGTPVVYFQQNSREPIIKVKKVVRPTESRSISDPALRNLPTDEVSLRLKCPKSNCRASIPANLNFCTQCGCRLIVWIVCRKCEGLSQSKNDEGNDVKFCGACGSELERNNDTITASTVDQQSPLDEPAGGVDRKRKSPVDEHGMSRVVGSDPIGGGSS